MFYALMVNKLVFQLLMMDSWLYNGILTPVGLSKAKSCFSLSLYLSLSPYIYIYI